MLKTLITSFICCILFNAASAQDKELPRAEIDRLTDSVMAEGKALFRSEWASWHGTDIFLEKCKDKKSRIGGYVSYETPDNLVNVFFEKGDKPSTLGVITFGKDYSYENYQLDTVARALNNTEQDLFALRRAALNALNKDTIFKSYPNTDLNVIPFINNGTKKIYILTAPTELKVVGIGNDYLLNVNNNNEITSVKRIHNSYLPMNTKENATSIFHSHLVGKDEMMSATDICTLMLYEKENGLKQAYVMSKKYVSIWDCEKDTLLVLTKEAWDRISAHQKEKNAKQ